MKRFETVLTLLEEIAKVPGKKDKERLVSNALKNADFEKVVVLMLNPFIRFYIRDFSNEKHLSMTYTPDNAYLILEKISNRELSGNAARTACGELVTAGFPAELMTRILTKNPKAGFSDSTVNKAKKGLIPEFPYMRCSLPKDAKFHQWDWTRGVISQEKADGMYAALDRRGDDITLSSRSGSQFDLSKFSGLMVCSAYLKDQTQTQGELLVYDTKNATILPREIGNGILNSVKQGGDFPEGTEPVYHVWDQIDLPPAGQPIPKKINIPYMTRLTDLRASLDTLKKDLESLSYLPIRLIDTQIVHSKIEAMAHYSQMLELGKEGTILSEPNAPWIDGTSKFKIKFKLTAPCELRVIGTRPGKGKNASLFGSLICESEDGLLEVAISGFKDDMRKHIFDNLSKYMGSIVTVDSNMIMAPSTEGKKWSLFLPRFAEFRQDKDTADTLDKIKEQFENATKL